MASATVAELEFEDDDDYSIVEPKRQEQRRRHGPGQDAAVLDDNDEEEDYLHRVVPIHVEAESARRKGRLDRVFSFMRRNGSYFPVHRVPQNISPVSPSRSRRRIRSGEDHTSSNIDSELPPWKSTVASPDCERIRITRTEQLRQRHASSSSPSRILRLVGSCGVPGTDVDSDGSPFTLASSRLARPSRLSPIDSTPSEDTTMMTTPTTRSLKMRVQSSVSYFFGGRKISSSGESTAASVVEERRNVGTLSVSMGGMSSPPPSAAGSPHSPALGSSHFGSTPAHARAPDSVSTSTESIPHRPSPQASGGSPIGRVVSIQNVMGELLRCPFYFGCFSGQESMDLLEYMPDDSFLVRNSDDSRSLFAVTYRTEGRTGSTRIQYREGLFSLNFLDTRLPQSVSVVELMRMCMERSQNEPVCMVYIGEQQHLVYLRRPILLRNHSLYQLSRRTLHLTMHRTQLERLAVPPFVKKFLLACPARPTLAQIETVMADVHRPTIQYEDLAEIHGGDLGGATPREATWMRMADVVEESEDDSDDDNLSGEEHGDSDEGSDDGSDV